MALASGEDQRRYRRVGKGLFWAGVLAAICTAGGTVGVPEKEVMLAFPRFWHYKYVAFGESVLWFVACLYTWQLRRLFRYIEATIAAIVAFSIISHFVYALVLWTGGLKGSVFAATFLSLMGISLLVPEDAAIKIVLAIIVLIEGVALVCIDVPNRQHNSMILTLSVVAFFFAAIVRWLLNRDEL